MSKKIGRNDPCPCGSGLKYKKCCLAKSATVGLSKAPLIVLGDLIQQKFDNYFKYNYGNIKNFNDFAASKILDIRRRFFAERIKLVGSIDKDPAYRLLTSYLKFLEREVSKVASLHSHFYWLNISRRIHEDIFYAGIKSPLTAGNRRVTLELAILKYGDKNVNKDCILENVEMFWNKKIKQIFDYKLTSVDLRLLFDLLVLCFEYYQVSCDLRWVGKGAAILVKENNYRLSPSTEIRKMVGLYDRRLENPSSTSLLGRIGFFEKPEDFELVSFEDLYGLQQQMAPIVGIWRPLTLNEQKKIPQKFKMRTIGKRKFLIFNQNFFPFPVNLSPFISRLAIHPHLEKIFLKRYKMTIEEVVFCIRQLYIVQFLNSLRDIGASKRIRSCGLMSYDKKLLFKLMKISTEKLKKKWKIGKIRKNTTSLLSCFFSLTTFNDSLRNSISLWDRRRLFLLLELGGYMIVDFTNSLNVLYTLFEDVAYDDESRKIKSKDFVDSVHGYLTNKVKGLSFLFPPRYKVRRNQRVVGDIDLSPVKSGILFLVECKTRRISPGFERGDYRAVKNRWGWIASNKNSWLNQADSLAKKISTSPTWDNGQIPKNIKYVVPLVCSSFHEYIWEDKERHFLNKEVPRISTIGELTEYLKSFNKRELSKKPYIIRVRHEAGKNEP